MAEFTSAKSTVSRRAAAAALRLPAVTLAQLHHILDLASSRPVFPGEEVPSRRYRRWVYREPAIRARIEHLGGTVVECDVAPRDLSCAGIGLLHNGFLHAGTVVTLTLTSFDGEQVLAKGKVRWCRHTVRQVHESGVEFDTHIDARHFIALDNTAESLIFESVAPEQLSGSLLHVEPNPAEQRLLAHMLRQTDLKVESAADVAQASQKLGSGPFDIIITEANLGDRGVVDLVRVLQARMVETPVIVLTSLSLPAIKNILVDEGVSPALLLAKPFDETLLTCAAAQCLLANADSPHQGKGPIRSRLLSDPSLADLIVEYVQGLHRDAESLADLAERGEIDTLKRVVHMLRSSGASYGFEPVSTAAAAVEQTLQQSGDAIDAAQADLRRLIDTLRRCTPR